ncbi:hypothetical protein PoB_000325500 [Plakobranchus ocellatus]|uniref:Uncharacterized protein n=1 Tax=Plakobranchus ocellatus TaxID=259542 RepID=A0AAV3Y258_9GAST|nr:hypothetical protein PoB_000325500 [Plakobranchus ocellatus]
MRCSSFTYKPNNYTLKITPVIIARHVLQITTLDKDDLAQKLLLISKFKISTVGGNISTHSRKAALKDLKKSICKEKGWAGQLEQFYYSYNNIIIKSTRPSTPYEKFLGRSNFSTTTAEMIATYMVYSGYRSNTGCRDVTVQASATQLC